MGALIEGGFGAIGTLDQGAAASQSARYNAALAGANAVVSKQNAAFVANAGEEQAAISQARTRAGVGAIKVGQGATGVDVNTGSAAATRQSAAEIGQLDAMTIRTNAAREAYGHQVKAVNETAQQGLDLMEAKNDTQSSQISAGTTFLGTLDNASQNFSKFLMAGGIG